MSELFIVVIATILFFKAANLLQIRAFVVAVHTEAIRRAQAEGVRCLILVYNMGSTMFGSVDDLARLLPLAKGDGLSYKVQVDGVFGKFIYPFT